MSKPVGWFAVHGGEPATSDGFKESSAPRFNAVSPFAGAVALGPPMVREPVVVVAVAAVLSTAVVGLVTEAMKSPAGMFVPTAGRFTSHDWKLALAEVIVVEAAVVCTSCTKRDVVWFAAGAIETCSVVLVAVAALDNTTVVALVTDAIVVPCP